MDSVIKLETPSEDSASDAINYLYQQATEGRSVYARNVLKQCYRDTWKTIKNRMQAEGSTWYVWYMDGVREFMRKYPKSCY